MFATLSIILAFAGASYARSHSSSSSSSSSSGSHGPISKTEKIIIIVIVILIVVGIAVLLISGHIKKRRRNRRLAKDNVELGEERTYQPVNQAYEGPVVAEVDTTSPNLSFNHDRPATSDSSMPFVWKPAQSSYAVSPMDNNGRSPSNVEGETPSMLHVTSEIYVNGRPVTPTQQHTFSMPVAHVTPPPQAHQSNTEVGIHDPHSIAEAPETGDTANGDDAPPQYTEYATRNTNTQNR